MKYDMTVVSKVDGSRISEGRAMSLAGLGSDGCDFECVGMQDDGTPVVFNKCGIFGYLDTDLYEVKISLRT